MFDGVGVLGCKCHWCCECVVLSASTIRNVSGNFFGALLVDVFVDARVMKYSMRIVKQYLPTHHSKQEINNHLLDRREDRRNTIYWLLKPQQVRYQ